MDRRHFILGTVALGGLSACAAPMAANDIVSIASGNDDFSTLVAAVQAAGLVDTLQGPGPFTVFAPTNAAFAALPPGTVDTLLRPENRAQLTDILTYHVVPGRITADQLVGRRTRVATVQGGTVHIDGRVGKTGAVRVNNANVILPDIIASNGVIHAIDAVLMP
ncbi:fasciclin domain-containing protein [Rhodobacteraceae bacterium CCMM004]|nr:fasciclin domain-containing protein [Rhodobacteraceae bacterium CCMM004]